MNESKLVTSTLACLFRTLSQGRRGSEYEIEEVVLLLSNYVVSVLLT